MEEPSGTNSPAAAGNIAIPDWMLKRRARQAEAGGGFAGENASPERVLDADLNLSAPASEKTEVSTDQGVEPSRREPPAWFRSKKTAAALATPVRNVAPANVGDTGSLLPAIDAEHREEPEWYDELRERWLGKAAFRSYAISIFMHFLIALPLSLLVFHQEVTDYGLNTLLAVQEDGLGSEELDEIPVMQMEASGGTTGESLDTLLTARAVSNPLGLSTLQVPDAPGGLSQGDGKGVGDQFGDAIGGYKMPEGGKAVSKGSFTAWTVPEDPAPGEDYKIVIQVKYKKRNQKIPKDDISGSVIGTDRFRLMISHYTSEVIPDANQVVVFVPGAAARVRDTIRVNSALLKEHQRLEIVF